MNIRTSTHNFNLCDTCLRFKGDYFYLALIFCDVPKECVQKEARKKKGKTWNLDQWIWVGEEEQERERERERERELH